MNVTPLVDVVLVLLIIFMVIAPQLEAGAAVDMPAAANPDPKTDVEYEPITVSVTRHGETFVEREPVSDLEGVLRDMHARVPDRRVQIRGDRGAPYRTIRSVFKTCQSVGFPGVGLQVSDLGDGDEDGEERGG